MKNLAKLLVNLCTCLAILLLCPAALAQAWIEDRSDWLNQLRILQVEPAGTTSQCIGDLSWPLCAMETHQACLLRQHYELCDLVGRPVPKEDQKHRLPGTPTDMWITQILGETELEAADIPESRRHPGPGRWRQWEPGDVAILYRTFVCRRTDACRAAAKDNSHIACLPVACDVTGIRGYRQDAVVDPRTYILRRRDEGWQVIDILFYPAPSEEFWSYSETRTR